MTRPVKFTDEAVAEAIEMLRTAERTEVFAPGEIARISTATGLSETYLRALARTHRVVSQSMAAA